LTVPGRNDPFELAGEVIHADPAGEEAGMGIRFVWGAEHDRLAFEGIVEGLMSESLGPLVTQNLLKHPQQKN
jgi:type IV pilus assembly protein PilZ